MINRIKTGLLAAIGFTNHNGVLQYLHNPHIHYNLDGEPTLIIGNASDNQGEFTLISITVASGCKYFGTISITSRAPVGIAGPNALLKTLLEGTRWHEAEEGNTIACWTPKIFSVFFGTKMVRGSLMDDAVLSDFSTLGDGYAAYASQVRSALAPVNKANEDASIITKVLELQNGNGGATYLHAKYDDEKYAIGRNGSVVSIDLPKSEDYPEIAEKIGNFFCITAEKPAAGGMTEAIQKLVLRSDSSDKESVIQEGLSKLKLFFLCGTMDPVTGSVLEPQYPIFSKGFQAIIEGPKGTMASKLKNLISTAFSSAETADIMSAYAETSIRVIQKSLADLILNGEFSTEPVLSIAGEANTLSFDSLLPQVYHDKIDKVQKLEQTLKMEGLVGLSDTQKSKPKMTIQRLGNITDHKCILSGLINLTGLAAALFDMEQMEELQISPLIIQIAKGNLRTYRSHRTKLWIQAVSRDMPQHPWNMFAQIDASWASLGRGAHDFRNVNCCSNNKPPEELVMTAFNDAIQVYATTQQNLRTLVNLSSADKHVSHLVPAGIFQKDVIEVSAPRATSPKPPARPRDRGAEEHAKGLSPKEKRGRSNQSGPEVVSNKSKGFIVLKDPAIDRNKVFPSNMEKATKPCADFVCQGKECEHSGSDCPHGVHAFKCTLVPTKELDKIAKHFKNNGHAWFIKNHMIKNGYKIPSDCEALLGNSSGPSKSA